MLGVAGPSCPRRRASRRFVPYSAGLLDSRFRENDDSALLSVKNLPLKGIQGEIGQTAECSEENWNRIIGINLTKVWLCMKHELAYMLPQGSGTIVKRRDYEIALSHTI